MWLKNNNLAREELWRGEWIARKMAFFSLCRFSARHEMGPGNQWARYNFCKIIIPWLQPSRLQWKKNQKETNAIWNIKIFTWLFYNSGQKWLKNPMMMFQSYLKSQEKPCSSAGWEAEGLRCGGAWGWTQSEHPKPRPQRCKYSGCW